MAIEPIKGFYVHDEVTGTDGVAKVSVDAVHEFVEDVTGAVDNWLDEHPEATTTVEDGSVTDIKLAQSGGVLDTVKTLGQNKMFSDLYSNKYVGHKGFSGWINDSTSNPVVQSNSLAALDLAKKAGLKFVETDTTILSDGTWVISHETDTGLLSGDVANLIDIDLNNFKSRKVIREYLTSGTYWTYSESEQYTPITLEEYLLRCKELSLYVLPEVKWITNGYENQNWVDFANVVKSCGMENNIIIYAPYISYIDAMYKQLPNTPVCCSHIKSEYADEIIEGLSHYPFALACTGASDYSSVLEKCIDANIPLGLWTVDDYDKAKKFIADGGSFLITDCLTNTVDATEFFVWNEFGIDEFYARSSKYLNTGSHSFNDHLIAITTETYGQVYLRNLPCSPQDVIEVSVKVKCDGVGEGQILIYNGLSDSARRRVVSSTKSSEWQTLNAVFFVGSSDPTVNIALHNRNQVGGSATVLFKDLVIKHYSVTDQSSWTELEHIAYAKNGKSMTLTKKASASAQASTWTKIDALPFPLFPTRDLEFPILANATGSITGILRVDKYGDVKIYCSSATSAQYFTVSYDLA